MKRAVLAAVIVAGLASRASAHPLDLGYLRVDVHDREVTLTLDLEAGAAAGFLGVDRDGLDAASVPARARRLAEVTDRLAPIVVNGAACAWGEPTATRAGTTVTIADRATCDAPVGALSWRLPFVARGSSRFQVLARVRGLDDAAADGGDGGEIVAVVDRAHPVLAAGERGAPGADTDADAHSGFVDFVRTGVAHIGVARSEWHGPDGWHFPDGIDHILFVLALLLAGGTLRDLARIITAFTAGHSISLAIATLGVARPPAHLVEPLIALSIAVVAAEAFAGRPGRHRWRIAMLFGVVHGFGFAGALRELDLSLGGTLRALVGFNLGVELGQLAIIAAALPLVRLAARDPRTRPLVTRAAPAAIFVAGMYWFVVRLFA